MYQGKHYKKSPRRSKRSMALLVSLCLIVGIAIGGTVAYLSASTSKVENTFTPSKVTTSVEEELENGVKKNVTIKNTGDTTAYIRAAVVVTWQDAEGNVYGKAPAKDDYTMTLKTSAQTNPEGQWIEGADGFYYWTQPVKAGENTGILIEKAELNANVQAPADGYYLCIEILGSGIQSEPAKAVESAWPAVKVVDGKLAANTISAG